MLTRIEIDGFKSFDHFGLDLPPFLVVLGQNASGKSNLFDAIQLLSRLATAPRVKEAFNDQRGDLLEQFRRRGDGTFLGAMTLAVELTLEPSVVDSFGEHADIRHTRVRYELQIVLMQDDEYVSPMVVHEAAYPIGRDQDRTPDSAGANYDDLTSPLLETVLGDAERTFVLHRQGEKARFIRADLALSTVLSTITSVVDFPYLFAIRREFESWRFLQLDPVALRMPSRIGLSDEQLAPSGANLAAVLRRIERATRDDFGSGLDEIAVDLVQVIQGFSGVEVKENKAAGQWEIELTTGDEGKVSARVASDGTLRVLALLAALYDPEHHGLLCFEEPENGIFPQRLRKLMHVLKALTAEPEPGEPLTQVILTSHSPLMLAVLEPADIVVMDWVSRVSPGGPSSRVSRVRVLADQAGSGLEPVSRFEQWELLAITKDEARRLLEG
ncbi:AAA family ATPase [Amycolatopsis orientalis]|uniref:AAA family ATPase n=1 Tax=Amycolatopsis orientalis TaxID=31958 RepID=UPI00040D446B|nr:AAA family ATPase [Amycolatopsis orientalis]